MIYNCQSVGLSSKRFHLINNNIIINIIIIFTFILPCVLSLHVPSFFYNVQPPLFHPLPNLTIILSMFYIFAVILLLVFVRKWCYSSCIQQSQFFWERLLPSINLICFHMCTVIVKAFDYHVCVCVCVFVLWDHNIGNAIDTNWSK